MKQFTCSYRHLGEQWNFVIFAEDFADADARMRSIRGNACVDGELMMVIPANALTLPLAALFTRLVIWFKNLGR
jgi:hypothetical protein